MKKLYKIIFLRKFNEQLNIVKIIELNEINEILRINNKTFKLKLNNVCYIHKMQKIYFLDFDSGNQYSFEFIKAEMNPNQLDILMSTKIIKELTSGIIDNKKEKIILIIIGFIIGLILGLLIMQIISSGKIEEILLNQNDNIVIPPFQSSIQIILRSLSYG